MGQLTHLWTAPPVWPPSFLEDAWPAVQLSSLTLRPLQDDCTRRDSSLQPFSEQVFDKVLVCC